MLDSENASLATIALPEPDASSCTDPPRAVGAGDVNGDGAADIAVTDPCSGAGGAAWVVFGPWRATHRAVDLSALNGEGFEIDGSPSESSGLGWAVAGGHDLNGDRKADLVLGAPGASRGAAAYVIFGTDATDTISVDALDGAGYRVTDSSGDGLVGQAVASPGDLNGDGRDDLVVGEPGASPNGRRGAGEAFVLFGGGSTADVDVSSLGVRGFAIEGASAATRPWSGSGVGASMAPAGDANDDRQPDLVLGSAGLRRGAGAYVVYGGASTTVDLARSRDRATAIDVSDRPQGVEVGGGTNLDGRGGDEVVVVPIGGDGRGGEAYVVSLAR
jgi:hypothetical protein